MNADHGEVTLSFSSPSIARVKFGHPRGNSLPRAVLTELAQKINQASASKSCRVIILESAGDGPFCAGASFDELTEIKSVDAGEKFFSGFAEVILALNQASQVTVAKIQGKCAGGGVGLACATDYSLALSGAAVRLSELAIGIGPFTIGPVVEQRVGAAAFTELALSAEWRDAEWAHRNKIFTELFPTEEELEKRLQELALKFASYPQAATTAVKRMVGEGARENLSELLKKRVRAVSELVVTAEAQALIAAAKRR